MTIDTWLPDDRQAQLEQAIRDVIGGISHAERHAIRELPDPSSDEPLALPDVPKLTTITVESLEDERQISLELRFSPPLHADRPVIPDKYEDACKQELVDDVDERDPSYLGDLSGSYSDLSDSVIETLNAYCDVPESEPERMYLGERADFLCTLYAPELVNFSAHLAYPEYVETVYSEGRGDLAAKYGLPY